MKGILDTVDDGLLRLAQAVTDGVAPALGIDNWSIARGALRLGAGIMLLVIALLIGTQDSEDLIKKALFTVAMVGVSLIWLLSYMTLMRSLDMQQRSSDAGRALRVSEKHTRKADLIVATFMIALQLTDINLTSGLLVAGLICFHLHYHFKAADTPPPSVSTKASWNGSS